MKTVHIHTGLDHHFWPVSMFCGNELAYLSVSLNGYYVTKNALLAGHIWCTKCTDPKNLWAHELQNAL